MPWLLIVILSFSIFKLWILSKLCSNVCKLIAEPYTLYYTWVDTIRGLTGHGSPRIHKVPICLSWSREPQIACSPCPRFWTWSWIYSCGMWCRWAYWFDNAVRTYTFSILDKPQILFLFMLVLVTDMTITMIHYSCVLDPGDKIVDCPPTFTMYEFDAAVNGALVIKGKNNIIKRQLQNVFFF